MSVHRTRTLSRGRAAGFGLVEIMVGLVIGLIGILVIYQVYNVAEGFKRNTTAAGEAQMAGLFSSFVLGMEIANGGAGIAISAPDLASCVDTGNIASSFRPIPVLITDGGAAATPDSFVVTYSVATTEEMTGLKLAGIPTREGPSPGKSPGTLSMRSTSPSGRILATRSLPKRERVTES